MRYRNIGIDHFDKGIKREGFYFVSSPFVFESRFWLRPICNRSPKEIMDDTNPLEALMVDLGDEEYSNSSQPGEKDEMILGENVSLTSSEAIDSPFKHE